jgi:membrane-bound serine protease (ClpP class)
MIELRGEIDPGTTSYFRNRLSRAKFANADLIIVEIDSPGGYKTESLLIGELLRDVDWAYTIAYVPREAISGAALLSLGCDEIVCDPMMRFGDIGPIHFDPTEFAFRLVPAKLQSVLVREARDLASSKGHSPEMAEAMIDKDVLVYTRPSENGIGLEFKSVHVTSNEQPVPPWKLLEESGPERFLTLNGQRAFELGLATALVANRDELAKTLNYEPARLIFYSHTWADTTARILNSFWITGLLVVVGLLALYLEMSSPGIGVGALVAGLCALLFFWSHFLGGTAGWLEVLLFFAGLVFLFMELFVIPGWGISGFLGLIMLFSSVIMAGQDFVLPSNSEQWNHFLTNLFVILCCICVAFAGAAMITKKIGKIPIFNQMVLAPRYDLDRPALTNLNSTKSTAKPVLPTHPIVSLGDWGKTESLLRPAGRANFAGRSIDVVSDGQFIERGQPVKVIEIQGHVVVVTIAES